jgi:hypothetical protein
MKKLFIPAMCVGFVTTVSMLEAGISMVPQSEPTSIVHNSESNKTQVTQSPTTEPVVAQASAVTSVTSSVQPADDQKKAQQEQEEFEKEIAQLEKLFAEEMKKAEADNKQEEKEIKATEQKVSAEIK